METLIIYPDAYPETITIDGFVGKTSPTDMTWAAIRSAAGNVVEDSEWSEGLYVGLKTGSTPSVWRYLYRSILLFDTSPLAGKIIDSVTLSVCLVYPFSDENGSNPDISVFSSNPASNNALVAADFGTLGVIPFATPKLAVDLINGVYTDFVLNASGIASINKSGISKFGLREATHDAGGATPTAENENSLDMLSFEDANNADGTGKLPKLTVVFHEPAGVTSILPDKKSFGGYYCFIRQAFKNLRNGSPVLKHPTNGEIW